MKNPTIHQHQSGQVAPRTPPPVDGGGGASRPNLRGLTYDQQVAALAPVQLKPSGAGQGPARSYGVGDDCSPVIGKLSPKERRGCQSDRARGQSKDYQGGIAHQKGARKKAADWQNLTIHFYDSCVALNVPGHYEVGDNYCQDDRQQQQPANRSSGDRERKAERAKGAAGKVMIPVGDVRSMGWLFKRFIVEPSGGKYSIAKMIFHTGHGTPGKLQVGATWITLALLRTIKANLFGLSFAAGAQIDLIACSVAKGAEGTAFLTEFSRVFSGGAATVKGSTVDLPGGRGTENGFIKGRTRTSQWTPPKAKRAE